METINFDCKNDKTVKSLRSRGINMQQCTSNEVLCLSDEATNE
jgi:hypothetical protein